MRIWQKKNNLVAVAILALLISFLIAPPPEAAAYQSSRVPVSAIKHLNPYAASTDEQAARIVEPDSIQGKFSGNSLWLFAAANKPVDMRSQKRRGNEDFATVSTELAVVDCRQSQIFSSAAHVAGQTILSNGFNLETY